MKCSHLAHHLYHPSSCFTHVVHTFYTLSTNLLDCIVVFSVITAVLCYVEYYKNDAFE